MSLFKGLLNVLVVKEHKVLERSKGFNLFKMSLKPLNV